jgi:hypothetical protein
LTEGLAEPIFLLLKEVKDIAVAYVTRFFTSLRIPGPGVLPYPGKEMSENSEGVVVKNPPASFFPI